MVRDAYRAEIRQGSITTRLDGAYYVSSRLTAQLSLNDAAEG